MVQEFRNQDSEYRAALSGGPVYVGNGLGIGRIVVHRSECRMLNLRKAGQIRDTSYGKAVHADLQTLMVYLRRQYGAQGIVLAMCSFCHPE